MAKHTDKPAQDDEEYSDDATIRAGRAARTQSFTDTTDTEQLHSGPPETDEDAEEETENEDGTAKQPAKFTDLTPPANPNAKGAATPATAGATAAKKTGAKKQSREELEGLTVAELKELAEKRGVDVPSGSHKADYVDALA